ncbi:hypothetical protein M0R04_07935 [Candidatus Dojkabacteria bacterium]|jgi:hypothetical protein|nr:hypothetical protein [Candidatus Dojkabacteria bacterium]
MMPKIDKSTRSQVKQVKPISKNQAKNMTLDMLVHNNHHNLTATYDEPANQIILNAQG